MARLRIEASSGGAIEVDQGEHVVGRADDAALTVNSPVVSRAHVVVRPHGTVWEIEDCGSSGGSFVDGQPLTRRDITSTTVVHLADPAGPTVTLTPLPTHSPPAPPGGSPTRSPFAAPPAGRPLETHVLVPRVRIGRDASNDIVIEELGVSRRHAEILMSGGNVEILDLRSVNGTFVNGRRVSTAPLADGDLVEIGRHAFQFVDGRLEEYVDAGLISFSVQGIEIDGGGRRLVDGVDFALDERSLLAIVGPSGAGKSTLLSVLNGHVDPTAGTVRYEGRDLHRDGGSLQNRIGLVPQADLLHSGLTVRRSLEFTEQLRLPADVSDAERAAHVDEVLAQLNLGHRGDTRIGDLSGGERKRVNVATELLTEPSLLLLDEPASGLDAGLERTLMLLLRRLADSGRTVIVVTHSLDSLHLCDQILVLAPGGVPAYVGAPDALPDRFGDQDLVDVFHDMSTDRDRDWRDRREPPGDRPRAEQPGAAPPKGRGSIRNWLRQWWTLNRRYTSVLLSDRRNALLLLLQAPVLGLLMAVALPASELSPPGDTEIRFVSTAGLVLFVVLLGSTWLGANNAIREIAREAEWYAREREVGLSTAAFVLSKATVLGVITIAQSAVLVAIALSRQNGPTDAVVLGWPLGEVMIAAALAGVASMSLALLVSASVRTPDRAITLLPIILILQFVLSAGGVLPELTDKPVVREMSLAASAQWGFAASASTADLNELQSFTNQLGDLRAVDAADPLPAIEALEQEGAAADRWEPTVEAWATSIGVLIVLTVTPLVAAIAVLRRRRMT